jgi:aminoglycoside 3-N-acetyltransferase
VEKMKHWEKEKQVVEVTREPITKKRLIRDLHKIGLQAGDAVIVHTSMNKIGWIIGGSVTVIQSLMETVTDSGTIVMPAFTTGNTEPSGWNYPSVPKEWWPIIRDEMPPFTPEVTLVRGLGRIPEVFRKFPRVHRSNHPILSFTAWGQHAEEIVEDHKLDESFGENSPIGKLYRMDGKILLIGVGYDNNSSLHHAEVKANIPNIPKKTNGSAILIEGKRVWKTWDEIDYSDHDFKEIGAAYELSMQYKPQFIGQAESRLLSMRAFVDFSSQWMRDNRKY